MAKIKMKTGGTIVEHYKNFLLSKQASGLSEKTLATYGQHFGSISKHIAVDTPLAALTSESLDKMIVQMQDSGLSPNSIKSYTSTLKSFFSWCNAAGYTDLNIKLYKGVDTIKETYTDRELAALLKKPDTRKCRFSEFRNWVIINFLLNSGSRAATLRNIQNKDIDIQSQIAFYRHTKNNRAQALPLCGLMCSILRDT